jgi:hypothetical protein
LPKPKKQTHTITFNAVFASLDDEALRRETINALTFQLDMT